jgi:hypothetical protein
LAFAFCDAGSVAQPAPSHDVASPAAAIDLLFSSGKVATRPTACTYERHQVVIVVISSLVSIPDGQRSAADSVTTIIPSTHGSPPSRTHRIAYEKTCIVYIRVTSSVYLLFVYPIIVIIAVCFQTYLEIFVSQAQSSILVCFPNFFCDTFDYPDPETDPPLAFAKEGKPYSI